MMPIVRAVSLWGCTALPVAWAAVTSWPGRLAPWEAAGYLVVLAVVVPLVRHRPVGALLLAIAAWQVAFLSRAEVDSTLGTVVLAAGLVSTSFLAGRHASAGHRGVVVLVLAAAGAITAAFVVTGGVDTAIASAAGTAVLAVVPWSTGRYRRRYVEMVEAGWDRAEQWERDADRAAEQARTRERARLAAEMHDLVGHELAQAALHVGALEVSPTLPAEHRDAAHAARAGVTRAAERLADAVRLLHAEQDEPVESAEEVVDRARRSGLLVDLVTGGAGQPEPVIARTVHRVLIESITNAIKHSPGAPVAVHLSHRPDRLDVRVVNGPAQRTPADAAGSGQGLLGLAERVVLVGGRFDARPRPDGGFEVTASLPAKPVTTTTTRAPVTHAHRRLAERQVRRSARHTVLLTACISAAVVVSTLGYLVFDAATSVLHPTDYQRLSPGQAESEVADVLPARTRVDDPGTGPPPRAGATCRYYSTHPNPFDQRRHDLYRLCFLGGRLVDKALLTRDP